MTTDPNPTPPADPTAAELAALRAEKAERDAAAKKATDDELAELRAFKVAETERAAKAVKAPVRRPAEPAGTPAPAGTPPVASVPPKKRRGRGGAARSWFGEEDE